MISKRFLKFLTVGVTNSFFEYLLFIFLLKVVKWNILFSNIPAYLLGCTIAFFLNRAWTFSDAHEENKKKTQHYVRFICKLCRIRIKLYLDKSVFMSFCQLNIVKLLQL